MTQLIPELVAFLAIMARATVMLSAAPMLSMQSIPMRVRLAFALTVSFIVLMGDHGPLPVVHGLDDLIGLVISESIIGISIGLIARVTFEALTAAAQLVGLSTGLGYGGMIDPFFGGQSTALAQLLTVMASMMALEMNLHGDLVLWLVDSYNRWPPGTLASPTTFGQALIEQTLTSFVFSVRLALPLAVVGVVGNVLLGVTGRVVPRLGLQNIGFAISLLAGLWVLSEAAPGMASATVNALAEVIHA
jgi:flagellar biosynthetic protein FliR